MARFDLMHSEVLILKFFLTTSTILAGYRTKFKSSDYPSKCAEHIVVGRTVLAWQCSKRSASIVDSPSWSNESTSAFAAT